MDYDFNNGWIIFFKVFLSLLFFNAICNFVNFNFKYFTGLFTSRTTLLRYMLEHIRGGVVIGVSPMKIYSIISWWDFVFNRT